MIAAAPRRTLSALHAYPSAFTHESRILKETRSLCESGLFSRIVVGAVWDEGLAEHETIDAHRSVWRVRLVARRVPSVLGKILRFIEWYARLLLHFKEAPPDFVNCHSLSVLPLGMLFRLAFGSRIIYDTHELETETQATVGIRKMLSKLVERLLIKRAEAVIVVSESIAKWYRDNYELGEVHVIRNIPYSRSVNQPKSTILRDALGLTGNDLLFIYQGLIDEGRGIQIILDAFSRVPPERHVVFLGYGPLVSEVQRQASCHLNIHYHAPVPPSEVLLYTSEADVGLSLIENTSLSYYYSLPNKVFEYILSGVPVVVSDFPEMAKLVDRLGCGWKCALDAQVLCSIVTSVTRSEIAAKAKHANEGGGNLNWSVDEAVLLSLYRRLLETTSADRLSIGHRLRPIIKTKQRNT